MRKFHFLRNMIAMIAMAASFAACGDDNTEEPTPEPPAPVVEKPTVTLNAGEVAEHVFFFTVATTEATEVKWMIAEETTAADVLANGTAVEANKEVSVRVEATPDTEYTVYAAVKNSEYEVLSAPLKVKTLAEEEYNPSEPHPSPTLELTAVESTTNSITFRITSATEHEDCLQVVYMLNAAEGITDAELLEQGTAVEANATIEVTVDELAPATQYTVTALAYDEEASEAPRQTITMLTQEEEVAGMQTVFMNLGQGKMEPGENENEWVLSFFDDLMNRVVLYCHAPEADELTQFLPSASYVFRSVEENYSSKTLGWIEVERSYIQYGGVDNQLRPAGEGYTPNITFETYLNSEEKDSNSISTRQKVESVDGLYAFELSFSGKLLGETGIESAWTLDSFDYYFPLSTSPDGTKLLMRITSISGELYFCFVPGENKADVSNTVTLGKDTNGEWEFPEFECFEFDVLTEMDLSRSYLFQSGMGSDASQIAYFTGGKLRVTRNSEGFRLLAVDLKAKYTGGSTNVTYIFTQKNSEKGWGVKLVDPENEARFTEDCLDWKYNWN